MQPYWRVGDFWVVSTQPVQKYDLSLLKRERESETEEEGAKRFPFPASRNSLSFIHTLLLNGPLPPCHPRLAPKPNLEISPIHATRFTSTPYLTHLVRNTGEARRGEVEVQKTLACLSALTIN